MHVSQLRNVKLGVSKNIRELGEEELDPRARFVAMKIAKALQNEANSLAACLAVFGDMTLKELIARANMVDVETADADRRSLRHAAQISSRALRKLSRMSIKVS
ncbi:hypothetical protein [Roseateles noduli]|uniref:hypothetical protein n=1 Tax=Roseateles noduli TaxID=2052484 RepID=UPI003D64AEA4